MNSELPMREFNTQLWQDRATGRRDRALDKCYPARGVELEYHRNLLAISDMEATIEWTRARGVKVFFVKMQCGTYHIGFKMVTISSTLSPVNQSIVLLHELGHHLVGHDADDERFGAGYPRQNIPSAHKDFRHRLACIEEEIEAWNRGWKLAKRLDLRLERKEFDEFRVKCLRSYMKWGVDPGPRPLSYE